MVSAAYPKKHVITWLINQLLCRAGINGCIPLLTLKEAKAIEKKAKEKKINEQIQKIMRSTKTYDRKAYCLLKLGEPISSVQSLTQLSYERVKWVEGQIKIGREEKEIRFRDKRKKKG